MKILFLDIDGVLNSQEYFADETNFAVEPSTYLGYYAEKMDPKLVLRLNEILARTGAKVVISSSWRSMFSKEEILECLLTNGFVGEIIDTTLRLLQDIRGTEIQIWLDNTQESVESFVILDDDSDMGPLEDKLVQTTWAKGLQAEHVERSVEMLNIATVQQA